MAQYDDNGPIQKPGQLPVKSPINPQPPAGTQPPAGAGSTAIPGAGAYLGQEALYTQAYNDSINALDKKKGLMYAEFGLLPGGAVDPQAQYGKYQQMLQGQGEQLRQGNLSSRMRGLGMGGLAAQNMRRLRYSQGADQFGFKTGLANYEADDQAARATAKTTKDQGFFNAEQAGIQWGLDHPDVANTPAAPVSASTAAGGGPAGTIKWAGQNMNKKALASWLVKHGSNYATWAKNHPAAAKGL